MQFKIIFLSLLFTLTLSSTVIAGDFKTISESEMKKLMQDKSYVVLDIRTPDEVTKTGIIPGAVVKNFYDYDFGAYLKTLDTKKKYLIYCHSGGRSAKAADKMSDMGLKSFNYGGGITGWLKGKNPTKKHLKK